MQVRDRQWQQPLSLKGRPGYTEYISAYLGLPFIYCYLPQLPSAEKIIANPYNQGGQPVQPVKNAYNAYEKIAEINPYSIKDLKKFHGIMTKYIMEESGAFRRGEEGVL